MCCDSCGQGYFVFSFSMRCVSVLYWKLFQLKQTSAANIQKVCVCCVCLCLCVCVCKNTQSVVLLVSISL